MNVINIAGVRLALGTALCTAALLVSTSCKNQYSFNESVPSKSAIEFSASIDNIGAENAANSRLTPSTGLLAGNFEDGDSVGFYLRDQSKASTVLTYRNVRYLAKRVTINSITTIEFQPTNLNEPPYYQTFNLHDIYTYFPYTSSGDAYDPSKLAFSVKTDQSLTKDLTASDFMVASHFNVKPQQTSASVGDATKLNMNFKHQMTSVVIKLRNIDDVPFDGSIQISVVNTNTSVLADLTKAPSDDTEPLAKLTIVPSIDDVIFQSVGSYTSEDYVNQICYRGIVVPQKMTVGLPLIQIKLGTGFTARIFEYVPKADDLIVQNGGFVQGAEHVFDFVISGTQLEVAGGNIVPWGTGTVQDQSVDGNHMLRMNFELSNTLSETEKETLRSLQSANLTLGTKTHQSVRVNYLEAFNRLEVFYYQGDTWGYFLNSIRFFNADQQPALQLTQTEPLRIYGNPADNNYTTTIGIIDVQNQTLSAN